MTEIVNLRLARKARARSEKEADAAKNRAKFGMPKAQRKLARARDELDEKQLEGHRLDTPPTKE